VGKGIHGGSYLIKASSKSVAHRRGWKCGVREPGGG
jgi:hypothetical protein